MNIPPIGRDGNAGKVQQAVGIERNAMMIVDDEELLLEVLERACKICPGLVREILERTDARLTTVLTGGYVERYGAKS